MSDGVRQRQVAQPDEAFDEVDESGVGRDWAQRVGQTGTESADIAGDAGINCTGAGTVFGRFSLDDVRQEFRTFRLVTEEAEAIVRLVAGAVAGAVSV